MSPKPLNSDLAIFKSLWNGMMMGACAVDHDGLLVGMNLTGSQMLGWGATCPVSVSCHDLIDCEVPAPEGPTTVCPFTGLLDEQHMIWVPRTRLRCRSGTYCWVELKGVILEESEDIGYVLMFRDLGPEISLSGHVHRLASIPEESPFPIVEVDTCGHILYANAPMARLMEKAPIGQEGYTLALPERFSQHVATWVSHAHLSNPVEVQVGDQYFSWVFSPHPELGILRGYAMDITEQKQAAEDLGNFARVLENKNQELDQALMEAQAAMRAKAGFLATMSHEIRTPLNGLMGMAELLIQSSLTSDQRECADMIFNSGEGLVGIIDDILDFSKNESGQLRIENIRLLFREMMEDVLTLFSERAYRKGLDLAGYSDPYLPLQLLGDPQRVRQILCNFLSNAIKFTAEGSILIHISLLESQPCSDGAVFQEPQSSYALSGERTIRWVRISVRDSGIGIAPHVQDHLFQMFMQGDSSTSRQYGGTGLGLAICRQLAELMKGRVGVESQMNQGATFWCELPFEVDQDFSLIPLPKRYQSSQDIWIVSALDASVEVLSQIFDDSEMRVTRFASLDELRVSWEELTGSQSRPIGIIVDDSLGSTVYDLRESIQTFSQEFYVKIWCLRPFWIQPEQKEMRRVPDGVITLPIHHDQVYQCILGPSTSINLTEDSALSIHAYQRKHVTGQSTDETLGQEWAKRPVVMVVDDNPINQKVAEGMLMQLGCRVVLVENGTQALEYLTREAVDLILMDGEMPEMDGVKTTGEIRKLERMGRVVCTQSSRSMAHSTDLPHYGRVPIVGMTANVFPEHRQRCLESGMDDYFCKPLHFKKLKMILQHWLGVSIPPSHTSLIIEKPCSWSEDMTGNHKNHAAVWESQDYISPGTYYDLRGALEALEGDETLLWALFQIFSSTTPERLLLMSEAVYKEDRESLRRHLHQLKGSLGVVYALDASAMAERLEREAISASFQVLQTHVRVMKEVVNTLNVFFQAYVMSFSSAEKSLR